MSAPPPPTLASQSIRIPNLPLGPIVDENGFATDDFLAFMQTLITNLQKYAGNEGLVAASQSAADITTIQNATIPNPSGNSPVKTCDFGTILYDLTNNQMKMAINDGTGNPLFKVVTLT